MRGPSKGLVLAAWPILACAGARPGAPEAIDVTAPMADPATRPSPTSATPPGDALEPSSAADIEGPDLPWWSSLGPGVYRLNHAAARPGLGPGVGRWRLAVGLSAGHHHTAEGLLRAKVAARLGLRAGSGSSPGRLEPELLDVFVTRERRVYVLYGLVVDGPDSASSKGLDVGPAPELVASGRRRVGRHAYDGARHLYLECDVEGPIANPEWGATRVSAQLDRSPP